MQVYALSNVTTIITDTEITGLGSFETDYRTLLCTDTTSDITAFSLKVSATVIAVSDTPTLFDKRRKRCQAKTLKSIEIDVAVTCVLDILTLSVKT